MLPALVAMRSSRPTYTLLVVLTGVPVRGLTPAVTVAVLCSRPSTKTLSRPVDAFQVETTWCTELSDSVGVQGKPVESTLEKPAFVCTWGRTPPLDTR